MRIVNVSQPVTRIPVLEGGVVLRRPGRRARGTHPDTTLVVGECLLAKQRMPLGTGPEDERRAYFGGVLQVRSGLVGGIIACASSLSAEVMTICRLRTLDLLSRPSLESRSVAWQVWA